MSVFAHRGSGGSALSSVFVDERIDHLEEGAMLRRREGFDSLDATSYPALPELWGDILTLLLAQDHFRRDLECFANSENLIERDAAFSDFNLGEGGLM